jgi:hypothetical protein
MPERQENAKPEVEGPEVGSAGTGFLDYGTPNPPLKSRWQAPIVGIPLAISNWHASSNRCSTSKLACWLLESSNRCSTLVVVHRLLVEHRLLV